MLFNTNLAIGIAAIHRKKILPLLSVAVTLALCVDEDFTTSRRLVASNLRPGPRAEIVFPDQLSAHSYLKTSLRLL